MQQQAGNWGRGAQPINTAQQNQYSHGAYSSTSPNNSNNNYHTPQQATHQQQSAWNQQAFAPDTVDDRIVSFLPKMLKRSRANDAVSWVGAAREP